MGGRNSGTLHLGNNSTMSTILYILLMFLVVLRVPTNASAQLYDGVTGLSSTLMRRGVSISQDDQSSKAIEHSIIDSHYVQPNFTISRRVLHHFPSRNKGHCSHQTYEMDRKHVIFGMEDLEAASNTQYDHGGAFLMQVAFGTPPQHFKAVIDTRLSFSSIQCSSHQPSSESVVFHPDTSKSYKGSLSCSRHTCQFYKEYQMGCPMDERGCSYDVNHNGKRFKGHLCRDIFYLSTGTSGEHLSHPLENFYFGCAHHEGWDLKDAVGVLGLARGHTGLVEQWFASNFSYCLPEIYAHQPDAIKPTTELLINISTPLPNGQLWTVLTKEQFFVDPFSTYYNFRVVFMRVNDIVVPLEKGAFVAKKDGSGALFLDSTIEFTTLVKAAYDPFLNAIRSNMEKTPVPPPKGVDLELCYDITGDQTKFPSVTFEFLGILLKLPERNVFVQSSKESQGIACLAFKKSVLPYSLFGLVQQQGFQVIVDLDENLAAFVPDKC